MNDKKLDFCFEYEFENEGNLMITINYKKLLVNTNFMFNNCLSLTYLNLSKFNTDNIINMNHMFSECSSLTSLYLLNFKY